LARLVTPLFQPHIPKRPQITIAYSDRLPPLFSVPLVAEKTDCPASNSVTLDVGANIGSCTLMLVMAGKKVVAFEPNPHNLFFLTNSIKRLPPQFRQQLTLHAAGAGASAGAHKLFTQQGNFGNSILDNPNQSDTVPLHTVFTVTLDDALWPDPSLPPPCIPLMKMDVQGFEVQALKGAKRLLAARAIKRIATEVAPSFLAAQGAKASELIKLLRDSGFHFEGHLNYNNPQTLEWLDAQATMNPFHGIDVMVTL
jgi:FkbM family methyltransferase